MKRLIPQKLYPALQRPYHYVLALGSAVISGFPSRKIRVIAVTGTKGKSSTVELISAILEEAGYKTALSNTIRFKTGDDSRPNLFKMSMPGRGFIQRFIRDAVRAGCDYAVIEMTSQGALLYRHLFIDIDVFVVTNISPEHIEAHGSYEKYLAAKLAIGKQFEKKSRKYFNGNDEKNQKILIINGDDAGLASFRELKANTKIAYTLDEMKPYFFSENGHAGLEFTYAVRKMKSHLSGTFNLYNILSAIKTAESQGVPVEKMASALAKFTGILGRVEHIDVPGIGQDFTVIVDYAHTTDSLEKLYRIFRPDPKAPRTHRMIAVLGGTGGGRDRAKRRDMGKLAAEYCDYVVVTNEDPYDEDPMQIMNDVKAGAENGVLIIDRRLAIREAISHAKTGDIILITGKGTDPFIMGAQGHTIPWSDAQVAREELQKRFDKN